MKDRIPKIVLSLAFAVPASYAAVHVVRAVNTSDAIDTVLFYADVPDRISEIVTNFKCFRSG